jgi:hypothetical protein
VLALADDTVRLENYQPHISRVGKGISMKVIYPNAPDPRQLAQRQARQLAAQTP